MRNKILKGNRKQVVLLAAVLLVLSTILSACSSASSQSASKEEAEAQKEEAVAETEVAKEEPTPEPAPEPVVYEGIDMKSTLPGKEWIETFEGIVDEPKFVVFNDVTNKKVIVEDGQKVQFANGDTLAVFAPTGMIPYYHDGYYIKEMTTYANCCKRIIFKDDATMIDENTITVKILKDIDNHDDENIIQITCTLVPIR